MKTLILIILLLTGAGVASANDGWDFYYQCSTETHDIWGLEVDAEPNVWTIVPENYLAPAIYTASTGSYQVLASNYVYLWRSAGEPIGQYNTPERVDCDAEKLPYTPPMNECLGFYAPVSEFVVDGSVYSAGADGWVSFLVPTDAVWVWTVTVDGWTGHYAQTESEVCHYVD